jgi:hypothetical protein
MGFGASKKGSFSFFVSDEKYTVPWHTPVIDVLFSTYDK